MGESETLLNSQREKHRQGKRGLKKYVASRLTTAEDRTYSAYVACRSLLSCAWTWNKSTISCRKTIYEPTSPFPTQPSLHFLVLHLPRFILLFSITLSLSISLTIYLSLCLSVCVSSSGVVIHAPCLLYCSLPVIEA